MIKKWEALKEWMRRKNIPIDKKKDVIVGFVSHYGGIRSKEFQALGITDYSIYRYGKKGKVTMEITLLAPGFLIGKGGRTINETIKVVSEFINEPFAIKIKETEIWDINKIK